MLEYCKQDVEVSHKLYNKILSTNYSDESLDLEHKVQNKCVKMMSNGIGFDTITAQKFYSNLSKEFAAIPTLETGKSRYEGIAGNKARISENSIMKSIESLKLRPSVDNPVPNYFDNSLNRRLQQNMRLNQNQNLKLLEPKDLYRFA